MWGSDAEADVGYPNRNIRNCWLCEHILYVEGLENEVALGLSLYSGVDTTLGLVWGV